VEARRLYRSRSNKMVAGVCGGLAEYLGIDATIIRLLWAFAILFAGAGLLAYIICWLVMPQAN